MKKIIISIILIIIAFVLVCAVLFNFNQNKSEKQDSKTIRLAEVAHTIFYAPMYAAIENGYFEDRSDNYFCYRLYCAGRDRSLTGRKISGTGHYQRSCGYLLGTQQGTFHGRDACKGNLGSGGIIYCAGCCS